MRRKLLFASAALIATAFTAGCSTTSTGNANPTLPPSTSTSTSTSSPSPSPTRTPRITDDSGRAPVAFDPCLDLSDEQIRQLGYQPETRRKTDFPGGDYTFLSCSFKSTDYLIGIGSGNITFTEEQKKEASNSSAQPVVIDGRQALKIPESDDYGSGCTLAMQATYGIVILTRETSALGTKMSAPPCEGIEDTARTISQFMPKGT